MPTGRKKVLIRYGLILFTSIVIMLAAQHFVPTGSFTDFHSARRVSKKSSDPEPIDWKTLQGMNWRTGEVSGELKKLNGALVVIPGFVVPFEDFKENVTEFLLVPSPQACIHVPPPPPNQMIYVKMSHPVHVEWGYRAIWLEGILKISPNDSPYGLVSYAIFGTDVRPYVESSVKQ